jgi:hypothetical protein
MKKVTTLLKSVLFICYASSTTYAQLTSPKTDSLMADALVNLRLQVHPFQL